MKKKELLLLSLSHFATDVNQGALPAILPFFRDALNLSYTLAGTVVLFSNLSSSIIQPLFGYISDRKSIRWILPLSPSIAGAGLALSGYAPNYFLLILCVVISGIGVALFHPEGFKVAHSFTGEKKATGVSIFAFGGSLGLALGPIIAIFFCTHFGLKGTPFIMFPAVLVSFLIFLSLDSLRLPERQITKRKEEKEKDVKEDKFSFSILAFVSTIRACTQFGMATYIPFYYINYLRGNPLYAGKLSTTFLLSGAIGTLIGGVLADKIGHKRFLLLTLIISSVLLNLFFETSGFSTFILLAVSGMVLISSFGTTTAMGQILLPRHLGMASGIMVGLTISAGGLGLTLLGVLADRWGVPFTIRVIALLPLLGFLLGLLIKYPPKSKN
ncbi:MAG: MFS transporter [Desulfobacterota bacterium]|nr:MFS transporter [Thermodesulfobacteriota bacterium]MDW8001133.1 MFS transporter [Deltaproteobacteria bacterium]